MIWILMETSLEEEPTRTMEEQVEYEKRGQARFEDERREEALWESIGEKQQK